MIHVSLYLVLYCKSTIDPLTISLTNWGLLTHICISELGPKCQWLVASLLRCQTITPTIADLLSTKHRHWYHQTHYSDVIMSAMTSQITGISIVCSTVCSGADQRKHQSSASLTYVRRIHRSPVNSQTQKANNAENVSIWWRHRVEFWFPTW